MTIIGIIAGSYLTIKYQLHFAQSILSSPFIYVLLLIIAVAYPCLFKRVYNVEDIDNQTIDWPATVMSSIGHLLNILLAMIFTSAIILSCQYIFSSNLDDYLRYKKTPAATEINNRHVGRQIN